MPRDETRPRFNRHGSTDSGVPADGGIVLKDTVSRSESAEGDACDVYVLLAHLHHPTFSRSNTRREPPPDLLRSRVAAGWHSHFDYRVFGL